MADVKIKYVIVSCAIFSLVAVTFGCQTQHEKIIGVYDIDTTKGCPTCFVNSPELMIFENMDEQTGQLRYYRFEYATGGVHSGSYDFIQLDSCLQLILYPDSCTNEFMDVINTYQETDYVITNTKIKENCDGLFRRCIWNKRNS